MTQHEQPQGETLDILSALSPTDQDDLYTIPTHAPGPQGSLPLTAQMLREWASGDLFGLTQNVGMGWNPTKVLGKHILILSTQGGIREADGTPVALGYHTGHWEVGRLMRAAALEMQQLGAVSAIS